MVKRKRPDPDVMLKSIKKAIEGIDASFPVLVVHQRFPSLHFDTNLPETPPDCQIVAE